MGKRVAEELGMTIAAVSPPGGSSKTGGTIAYFAPLILLVYLVLPSNYLVDIATAFMLKNQLHVSAASVSEFRLVTAIPIYLSFLFGFARDLWNPFGMRDRGYLLVFSLVTVVVFLGLAVSPLTLTGLYVGIFLAMVSFRFISAAFQGLLALVGQEKLMPGRLAVVWQAAQYLATLAASLGGGYVAQFFSYSTTFLLFAFVTLLIGVFGFLRPRSIFLHTYDQPLAQGADVFGDIKRLVLHRAIYAPILMQLLFSFAPGTNTPLQYYLAKCVARARCHLRRVSGDLQHFVHSDPAALWLAVPEIRSQVPDLVGIDHHDSATGSVGTDSFGERGSGDGHPHGTARRSCRGGHSASHRIAILPSHRHEGTLMMMVDGVYVLASRGSDVRARPFTMPTPKTVFSGVSDRHNALSIRLFCRSFS